MPEFDTTPISPGAIAYWPNSVASIPRGWVFCDGLNGTPDLRDLYIFGKRQDGIYVKPLSANPHAHGLPALVAGSASATTSVAVAVPTVAVASSGHGHRVTGTTSATATDPPYFCLVPVMKT